MVKLSSGEELGSSLVKPPLLGQFQTAPSCPLICGAIVRALLPGLPSWAAGLPAAAGRSAVIPVPDSRAAEACAESCQLLSCESTVDGRQQPVAHLTAADLAMLPTQLPAERTFTFCGAFLSVG